MSSPAILAAALALAERGVPSFPVRADKRPACRHGHKDATTDRGRLRELFSHPAAVLLAIPTGSPTGTAVLDVDPQGIPWMRAQLTLGRLPETEIYKTPRGGFHFIYTSPNSPVRCSASRIAYGVDIRGEGGSCIVPPSEGYTVVSDAPRALWPDYLVRAIARLDRQREKRRAEFAERMGGVEGSDPSGLANWIASLRPGERNAGLFWAACRAGESLLPADMLIAAAIGAGLDPIEAIQTVRSGIKRGRQDAGG